MVEMPRVRLTDSEWVSLVNREREGLPGCCANVSALLDHVVSLLRNDGYCTVFDLAQLKQKASWVYPEHGEPSPAMAKLLDQLGIEWGALDESGDPDPHIRLAGEF